MTQKITNTYKHFGAGRDIGLATAGLQWVVNLLPKTQFQIAWMAFIGCIILSLVIEKNQAKIAKEDSGISLREYFRRKWLDSVIDVLVCVAMCGLTLGALGAF